MTEIDNKVMKYRKYIHVLYLESWNESKMNQNTDGSKFRSERNSQREMKL